MFLSVTLEICDLQAKQNIVFTILIAVLLIVFSCVLKAQSYSNKNIKIQINWSYKKNLPAPRIQGGAVANGNHFYYIGGRDSRHQKQNTVFKYDLRNNIWKTCALIPTSRWNFALTECQEKIYAIGGDILISSTEVFDPRTNSWETLPPLPSQRVSAGCIAIGDMIYVIGGWEDDTKPSVKNEAFNVKTEKWETKAPLPSPRMSFGSVLFNGKIYILGGTSKLLTKPIDGKGPYFFKPEKTILIYDPQEGSWEKHESEIPIVRIGAKAVVVNNIIFLLGGYTVDNNRNESFLTRVDIFDPKRNMWLQGTDLPKKLLFSGIAAINNSILVIGGWDEHYKATSVVLEGKWDFTPKKIW
jgi:N-acetylneuraminic acid mutarotase